MARQRKTHDGDTYVANDSFIMNIDGVDRPFAENRTYHGELVEKAVAKAPHLFDKIEDRPGSFETEL